MGRLALLWVVILTAIGLSATIMAVPLGDSTTALVVQVGQPAPQDLLAPTQISYVSTLLTTQARDRAEASVPDIYDAPDPRLARQQVVSLRDSLDYIALVRADPLALDLQKQADLTAIRDLALTTEEAALLLALSTPSWETVRTAALTVLEQIMRNQVREKDVEDVRRSISLRLSVNLTDEEVQAVTLVARNLIVPNSFFNAEATAAARQAAREAVAQVTKTVLRGQVIIGRGQVVTAEQFETLQQLGLLEPQTDWRTPVSAVLFTLLVAGAVVFYAWRFNPTLGASIRRVALLGLVFGLLLLAARLMVPGRTLLPFLVPVATLAMLVTVLTNTHLAIVVGAALALLVGYLGEGRLELVAFVALGNGVAALTVGRAERVNQFFYAGMAVAGLNAAVVLVFRLGNDLDFLGVAQLLGVSLINGAVAASLALAGMFFLGLFDITTSLQLIELSRPDQPLLREILRNAPGTYQHSLQVANLAEQAAERIGANALLTRVGALYHDAGKMLHPQFFIENQLDGVNIHDTLDPLASAQIIINHVLDGLKLARQYRLPAVMREAIAEHHGTLKTMYQYQRALKAVGDDATQVDATQFAYPGPRPQSKETALLMLADGCEARARAERPKSEADLARIVEYVVNDRLAKGQLDDTGFTLKDLALIRESFVSTLKGVFHSRLQYPDEKN